MQEHIRFGQAPKSFWSQQRKLLKSGDLPWRVIDCAILVEVFPLREWSVWYRKTCVKQPLSKRPKIGFQDQLKLNAGQKY